MMKRTPAVRAASNDILGREIGLRDSAVVAVLHGHALAFAWRAAWHSISCVLDSLVSCMLMYVAATR